MALAWQDKDKRRAFLLSVLVHTLALFLLLWLWNQPKPVVLESFLVIDVGTPALSETVSNAPTADAPAPQAAEPLVAATEPAEPVAQTLPEPAPAQAPEVPESPEAEVSPQLTEASTISELAPPVPVIETPPVEEALVNPAPLPVAEPVATPEAQEPLTLALPNLEPESLTALPEIEEVEISPQIQAQALAIPKPSVSTSVSPARTISAEARVEVRDAQALPRPEVQSQVEAAAVVPVPATTANVEASQSIPQPEVAASLNNLNIPQPEVSTAVSETQTIPQPQLQTTVSAASTVPQPNVEAEVSAASPVPQPNVATAVSAASTVPQPNVEAEVSAASPVPQPNVATAVSAASTVPQPAVQSSVAAAQDVSVSPDAQVATRQVVPIPVVSAAVVAVNPDAEAATAAETLTNAVEASLATPGQNRNAEPGGNADRSGQTADQEGADAANLGLAAGPEGSEEPTGAAFARVPYRESRDRPLSVILDNLRGYPQLGLLEASYIIEMPVEGGITRLMTVYDRIDPARVGPVRSTREYFLDVNAGFDGVMVHDGGSPAAMAAIDRNKIPTINAYLSSSEVFQRSADRSAPYNLYSQGAVLRQELNRRNQNQSRVFSGTLYRPEESLEASSQVTASYSADYRSGFRYIQDLNLYRWVRNGTDASDATGQAVYVDALVIANIEAVPVPGDTEGRLYIPMRGGRATLYLRGKTVAGRWDLANGIRFTSALGEVIDLAPFKTWVAFVPQNASVIIE